jgi:WD40 repeat protein
LAQFLDHLIEPALSQPFGKDFGVSAQSNAQEPRYNSALVAIQRMQELQGKPKIPPAKFMNTSSGQCTATLIGHQGLFAGVNALAIAADFQTIASASDDKTIRLWDLPTGQARSILRGHSNFVKSVTFHPTQPHLLASGSKDRTIKLWNTSTGESLKTLTGHQNQVNGVIFSAEGEILASCSADKTIYLWHHPTGEIMRILKGHTLGVNAIAFSPQAPLIASASADATVKIWNLTTGELITTLTAHTTSVKALAFSPSGKYLATGGEDRNIHLWDVESHQILRTLSGHPWDISALIFAESPELLSKNLQPKAEFNPESNTDILISGSWDKTVKLWQGSTGKNLDTLVGHTEAVNCIMVYQNLIISGSSDATIKLWNYSKPYPSR